MFGPIDIAISGMRAQNKSISAIFSNVANSRTTDNGKGEPYRRLEAIFKAMDGELGGVMVEELEEDMSAFKKLYQPGHPAADGQGFVQMPNINLPSEMVNLTIATKAYQANAAILRRYQQIVENALDLLR
ncbi:MAG: flagellar basal body rod protein FlgC [Planctomycetes bacterium]|nr:flagellar basal body rod protein FlgC [Planctomycetota bacterium]